MLTLTTSVFLPSQRFLPYIYQFIQRFRHSVLNDCAAFRSRALCLLFSVILFGQLLQPPSVDEVRELPLLFVACCCCCIPVFVSSLCMPYIICSFSFLLWYNCTGPVCPPKLRRLDPVESGRRPRGCAGRPSHDQVFLLRRCAGKLQLASSDARGHHTVAVRMCGRLRAPNCS